MMYSDRRDLFVTRFNCIHLHFVFILPEMDSESSTLVSWKTNERNSHREWCFLTEEICSYTRFNCIHLHFVFILPEMDSESSTLVSWKTNERNSHREWCFLTEEICLALNTTAFIFISSSSCQKWTQNHRHWFLGKPMKEILIENDVFWQKRSVRN